MIEFQREVAMLKNMPLPPAVVYYREIRSRSMSDQANVFCKREIRQLDFYGISDSSENNLQNMKINRILAAAFVAAASVLGLASCGSGQKSEMAPRLPLKQLGRKHLTTL